ncbi:lactose-binding lectin l-2-like [Amphibalanus amphitrite]|uniref:lactose-binding lectin l-2-like n=1 Tax=Amphibalanus amphitrite TaxID=1232801 RepID=UPI001C91AD82|nr:lactose-binding lectin l-2-like [Amphibalanus amphitrite]
MFTPISLTVICAALLLPAALADLQTERLLRGQEVLEQGQKALQQQLKVLQQGVDAVRAALGACPAGWHEHDGNCFRLFDEELTADGAAEACRVHDRRARLASADNVSRPHVHGLVDASQHHRAWIGLRLEEDGWIWSDGHVLESGDSDWLRGQPDDNGGERCVMYDNSARYGGWTQGWADERCVLTAPFVCQIKLRC